MEGEETDAFYLIDPVPGPTTEDVTPVIEMALAKQDCYQLVVLDTLGRSMQGLNENSQQDASTFTRMVEAIQHELNAAVLVLHHTGHEQTGRSRGSSVFGADVDAEFMLDRNEKDHVVKMTNTKQKEADEWEHSKIIELKEIGNSLVAVIPSKKAITTALSKSTAKQGRKSAQDKDISITLISKAAYQFLKSVPGKEFSKSALADGIATSEEIPLSAQTIRKSYLSELTVDKAHPLFKCFDAIKGVWVYRK